MTIELLGPEATTVTLTFPLPEDAIEMLFLSIAHERAVEAEHHVTAPGLVAKYGSAEAVYAHCLEQLDIELENLREDLAVPPIERLYREVNFWLDRDHGIEPDGTVVKGAPRLLDYDTTCALDLIPNMCDRGQARQAFLALYAAEAALLRKSIPLPDTLQLDHPLWTDVLIC